MIGETVDSFFKGLGLSLAVSSPAEWAVHKYILHATPKSRRIIKFIEDSSRGHNDNHHGAYKGPAHYYRDITNENEIIHFAPGDVGVIAGISGLVGATIDATYSALTKKDLTPNTSDASFVTGFVTGTMAYYLTYEFTHHYMHVIGQRRLEINRVLGDTIQGGVENRDGNLRLSKPLLDDICNSVETQVDLNIKRESSDWRFDDSLVDRLKTQLEMGKTSKPSRTTAFYDDISPNDVLETTADTLLDFERKSPHSIVSRKVQSVLRSSSIFKYLDNHHFFHHFRYGNNLNVVFPAMDVAMGTKVNSSQRVLESETRYWLCPNSPDISPFVRKTKPMQV